MKFAIEKLIKPKTNEGTGLRANLCTRRFSKTSKKVLDFLLKETEPTPKSEILKKLNIQDRYFVTAIQAIRRRGYTVNRENALCYGESDYEIVTN